MTLPMDLLYQYASLPLLLKPNFPKQFEKPTIIVYVEHANLTRLNKADKCRPQHETIPLLPPFCALSHYLKTKTSSHLFTPTHNIRHVKISFQQADQNSPTSIHITFCAHVHYQSSSYLPGRHTGIRIRCIM
nr:hypothetical protein HmN_000136900 [Hymenolepis microstoma]